MSDTIWTKMGRLTETLTKVAAQLTAHGWPTTVDYPGFLSIEIPDAPAGAATLWNVGTANENWGGEGYLKDAEPGTGPCIYVDTDVPSNEGDAARITQAIIKGIGAAYRTARGAELRWTATCAECGRVYEQAEDGSLPRLCMADDCPSCNWLEPERLAAHQQDDPHCTCNDCIACLEAEQNAHGLR